MANFDPDSMGSRYVYLDDPYDDTNPTEPVWSRMVARIFAGGQKSENGSNGFNGVFRRTTDRRQLQVAGGGARQPGEDSLAVLAGGRSSRR